MTIIAFIPTDPCKVSSIPLYRRFPTTARAIAHSSYGAYSLYCIDEHPQGTAIERVLSSMPIESRKQLACVYDNFGDTTSALASLYDRHLADFSLQDTAGLVGAGATVSENRITGFQKALRNYQSSLIKLSIRCHNDPKGNRHELNTLMYSI